MTATSIDSNALRSRARLDKTSRRHPFVAALYERGETVAEAAAWLSTELGRKIPRNTMQSWYRPANDRDYRAIHRDAAEAIKRRYGVPLSAWARIV
jgi:hypothetical protein